MRFLLISLILLVGCTPVSGDFREHDIELNNPTYKQVNEVLTELKGLKVDGNCCDYTQYIQEYFYGKGLQCYMVVTNFKGGDGHISVVFNIKDKGWVYVEPIVLKEYAPVIGEPYLPPGLITKGTVDDKIVTQLTIFR